MITYDVLFDCEIKIVQAYKDNFIKAEFLYCSTDKDSPTCMARGEFKMFFVGDVIKCKACFKKSEKAGFYMQVIGIPELLVPEEREAFTKYSAGQIPGVSAKTMARVYDFLGPSLIKQIANNPEVLEPLKLPKGKQAAITNWCISHQSFEVVSSELRLQGLSPSEAISAYKGWGSQALHIFMKNPYVFYYNRICSFRKCDKVGLVKLGKDSYERKEAIFRLYLDVCEENGHMAVLYENIENDLQSFMKSLKLEYTEITFADVDSFVKEKIIKKVFDKVYLAKNENYIAEEKIATFVKLSLKNVSIFPLNEIEENLELTTLEDKQEEAVKRCLSNKFSILTGGPGTGKTFTIRMMVKIAQNIKKDTTVALMAPTGKAASRMIEITGQEATTIHAKLGISENTDLASEDGMIIDEDLVIIDEASMIDEKLFAYLVTHISQTSQLVLVGDSGQLPSVGAGSLLEHLLKIVPYTQLSVTKRTGVNAISGNAECIRNQTLNKMVYNSYFKFIETENIVDEVIAQYLKWIKKGIRPMILAPQYSGPGVDVINKRIQDFNDNETRFYEKKCFKVGDRVIANKNTKALSLHNGDQGEVVALGEKISVIFDEKEDSIDVPWEDIDLAYCITAHKSQGSEAETVIMVFSSEHQRMLKNKLIYTAITRAKSHFIGIGSKQAFEKGCSTFEPERISLIEKIFDNIKW